MGRAGFEPATDGLGLHAAAVDEAAGRVLGGQLTSAEMSAFDGLAGSPLLPQQPRLMRRNAHVNDRRSLEIDPRAAVDPGQVRQARRVPQGHRGQSSAERWPTRAGPALEYLGEPRTDAAGRVFVVGGAGVVAKAPSAAAISEYANNDGWFDDVSDGPVTATLRLRGDGKAVTVPVSGAWIVVGPPDFAPDLRPAVTFP